MPENKKVQQFKKYFFIFVRKWRLKLIYCSEGKNEKRLKENREGMRLRMLTVYLAMIENEDDRDKFEQLYRQYRGLLFYQAHQLLHDEQLAEDAVSIAFTAVAKNMSMVKEAVSPGTKGLLLTIVKRTAINLYHKQQRDYAQSVEFEEARYMTTEPYTEQDSRVADAILQLPHPYQEVFLLKYAQGYQNKEIAVLLDFTVAKVEKLLSRGKKQLKELLEVQRNEAY